MIRVIAQFFIALNSNVKKTQIAAGFSWGVLLGLLPSGNVVWFALFLLSLFFKHNQGSKLVVLAILKIVMPLLYPYTDELGWVFLHIEALRPVFTRLYNMPFVPWTRFNNTLIAGGLAAGVVLWIPVFVLITLLIPLYRNSFVPRITNSKVYKAFKKFPLVAKISEKVISLKEIQSAL
jgi:uncharacterized protein (TIGR03546 family)